VARGLLCECGTLYLDRGYDSAPVRRAVVAAAIGDLVCPRAGPRRLAQGRRPVPLGLRWPVERTNAWPSNSCQLRRKPIGGFGTA
jgi:hypothetical protein